MNLLRKQFSAHFVFSQHSYCMSHVLLPLHSLVTGERLDYQPFYSKTTGHTYESENEFQVLIDKISGYISQNWACAYIWQA